LADSNPKDSHPSICIRDFYSRSHICPWQAMATLYYAWWSSLDNLWIIIWNQSFHVPKRMTGFSCQRTVTKIGAGFHQLKVISGLSSRSVILANLTNFLIENLRSLRLSDAILRSMRSCNWSNQRLQMIFRLTENLLFDVIVTKSLK
jgi:hypothetical protein